MTNTGSITLAVLLKIYTITESSNNIIISNPKNMNCFFFPSLICLISGHVFNLTFGYIETSFALVTKICCYTEVIDLIKNTYIELRKQKIHGTTHSSKRKVFSIYTLYPVFRFPSSKYSSSWSYPRSSSNPRISTTLIFSFSLSSHQRSNECNLNYTWIILRSFYIYTVQ
jgi:hypothetical protein